MNSPTLLSICIPTLNRGHIIGATLESIARQVDGCCEVVVIDGGSTDNTAAVVSRFAPSIAHLRYVRSELGSRFPSNEGFDRDCNLAVELASGTYCWLMADDDLLDQGAIAEVCSWINGEPDLIFACARICNKDFSQTLEPALPRLPGDREYTRSDWIKFVAEVGPHLTLVGRVIIKRAIWLARQRADYFGSGFVHVGVILSQALDRVVVLSRPLLIVRYGDALWRPRAFDIWLFHWPRLIWSFENLPDSAKALITPRHPYRKLRRLLWYRALGAYTLEKYRQRLSAEPGVAYRLAASSIARIPIAFTNALCSLYFAAHRSKPFAIQVHDLLHCGNAATLTRLVARRLGIH